MRTPATTLPTLVAAIVLGACAPATPAAVTPEAAPFGGPSPWPAIRAERIRTLLPAAMRTANVDAWVILARENANDPLALHVGAENAGAPAAFLFLRQGDAVRSVAISGFGEAIALRELGTHDSVAVYEREPGTLERAVAERLRAADPARIAINSGGSGIADGLSHTQRVALESALGAELASRLVPSQPLVRGVARREAARRGGDHAPRGAPHGRAGARGVRRRRARRHHRRRHRPLPQAPHARARRRGRLEPGAEPQRQLRARPRPLARHRARHPAGRHRPDRLRHQGARRLGHRHPALRLRAPPRRDPPRRPTSRAAGRPPSAPAAPPSRPCVPAPPAPRSIPPSAS